MNNFFNLRGLQKGRSKFDGWTIDPQALAHFNRVIADGGVVPTGLSGVNAFFKTVKSIYNTPDINSAISAAYDPHYLGYKLGAGSGTTLGQAAQKLYSCSGASADVTQTTAASQPLLLAHEGANYWFAPYSVTDNCSTPNAAANRITGDIEIVVNFSLNSINFNNFCSKWTSSNIQYHFRTAGGNLQFRFSTDGTTTQTISSTANISPSVNWVKLERNATNGEVKFYTSTNGTTWTQLGATVTGVSGNMFNGTAPLLIGQNALNGADGLNGKIFRVTIANSIGGTPVVDFNPSSYNASASQTQWTSATGEVWSINVGSATTGYKGVLVDRSIVQSDGIDDQLFQTTLNRPNTLTQYVAFNAYANTGGGGGQIIDSTNVNYSNSIDPESNTTIALLINGGASARGRTKNIRTLGLATAWNEAGVENGLSVNDGTASTNAYTPTPSNIGVRLMARANAAAFANALLSTYLVSNGRDSSTIRTGMYNTIRGFNNNAF